ncbi:MAG: CPBP family intramembrane glutamic endopeptidase, partial [Balneolaceae bacterium]|nr:CPBP family intramembrane glutamic endopeptidase [Balneolaceae bacterium]
YVMRSFEKSWGILAAIFVSGFVFGLYHLQLSNLLPLCTLGILFAYFTWVSGSILPAVAAHFINNAGSVVVATFYPDTAFAEMSPETMPPFWAVGLSLIITSYLIYFMYDQYMNKAKGEDRHV